MGILTKGSKRTRIQDYMKKMRDTFRAALKDARAQLGQTGAGNIDGGQ